VIAKGGGWSPGGHGVLREKITLAEDGNTFASTLLLALFDMKGQPVEGGGEATGKGVVTGPVDDAAATELHRLALAAALPRRVVRRLVPGQSPEGLPPELRSLLERVIEHRQKSHGELINLLSGLVSKLPINDIGVVVARLLEHNAHVAEVCAERGISVPPTPESRRGKGSKTTSGLYVWAVHLPPGSRR
jgi:hypothetical protein